MSVTLFLYFFCVFYVTDIQTSQQTYPFYNLPSVSKKFKSNNKKIQKEIQKEIEKNREKNGGGGD